ncbi:hypothetical protein BKA65DRAFT_482714 [Rhexocercosporidium sp. MPI-PUGE-AT-0058]|nr:hypothetical protein BKA65DRAFT_482714 [Rhexocercosporidium sp. MPI-PUGE-AT-0058]
MLRGKEESHLRAKRETVKMKAIPNFTERVRSELMDACVNYGLSASGTKNDIIVRLYSHAIDKRKIPYNAQKDRGFVHDLDGASLLAEVRIIKEAMKKAAEQQHAAEKKYIERRLERITKAFRKSEKSASGFAETETSCIRREI